MSDDYRVTYAKRLGAKVAQSDKGDGYHEAESWHYEPGVLELLDRGVDIEELSAAAFHGGGAITRGGPRLKRIGEWLRGYRPHAVLCEREPIWVPIAEVWPAVDGSVDFAYEKTYDAATNAEVRVFAVGGYGGASKRSITKAVKWTTDRIGRALQVRAFVSVHRYANARTGDHLDRVDVDCGGVYGDYRNIDLTESAHPFQHESLSRKEIIEAGFAVTEIQRCCEVAAPTVYLHRSAQAGRWSFEVGLDVPQLVSAIKLAATCEKATAFEAAFKLPAGHDYAFCARVGQSPVVPLCVTLRS